MEAKKAFLASSFASGHGVGGGGQTSTSLAFLGRISTIMDNHWKKKRVLNTFNRRVLPILGKICIKDTFWRKVDLVFEKRAAS